MIRNLKNPKIRDKIKRQLLAELKYSPNLPKHRKQEIEALLCLIEAHKKHEIERKKRNRGR